MKLLFFVVSLVIQIGSTEGTCRCLDQTLCRDPVSGCNYRCQPGFTGKKCQHDNLGYMSARNAKKLFDGDYSTCLRKQHSPKISFIPPIDVDTIRVHRENNGTDIFYAYVYINTTSVRAWKLPRYKTSKEGPAAAETFPVQTGVTAVKINSLHKACEVELTNDYALVKEGNPTIAPVSVCDPSPCHSGGTCKIQENKAVCECQPGYTASKCETRCSPGFYGANCETSCNEGCQPQHCNHVTGDCRCRDGWTGRRCETDCSKGFYGSGCTQRCAAGCEDGHCNHVNGSCVCTHGWIGNKCSKRCSRTYYGSECSHRCADGCVGKHCNHVDGSCMCKPGWMGDKCSENCPSGYYGPGCADSCSKGCYIGTCHHVNGNCSCKDGWTGEKCSEQCPSGLYGPGCPDSCSEGCEGGTCHHVSGNCDCKDGWTGEKCSEPTIAGPTAPSSGYVERSDLDCSAGQMHVHIPLSLLPIHTVTLRDPTCKVTSNGTHLVADVGLNECGTTVSFTNNSVIFTNDIVATVRLAAGVTTSNIIDYGLNKDNQRVAISCVFPRENRIDFGYVPLQRKAHFYEKQYGNLIFEINQYQDEQFTRMLPHTGLPIGVTLNTEIFIDIAVDHNSNKGVGITVESCIATPTQSPADPVWYPLIKNGCPVQSDIRTFSSPDENEFRFSFLAFKFTRSPLQKIDPSLPASPMVYLHCQVFACPRQNCTSSCQGHSRSRREAESENAHLISAGPFYLKSEEESQGYSGGIVAGTLSVACLTTLIALVAVVAWRRSVNKLSRYQNAQMTS